MTGTPSTGKPPALALMMLTDRGARNARNPRHGLGKTLGIAEQEARNADVAGRLQRR